MIMLRTAFSLYLITCCPSLYDCTLQLHLSLRLRMPSYIDHVSKTGNWIRQILVPLVAFVLKLYMNSKGRGFSLPSGQRLRLRSAKPLIPFDSFNCSKNISRMHVAEITICSLISAFKHFARITALLFHDFDPTNLPGCTFHFYSNSCRNTYFGQPGRNMYHALTPPC
ncbi:hypothetical protein EDB19DRAFT_1745905 [Suillus lakei]|nr:hypothetical protein EDB19DRAFT_1745905 [Suillus lakei]